MSGTGTGGGGAAGAALRAAAASGDVAACHRHLGQARCVRFSRDEEGRSALHLAASGGHVAVVRLLLNVAAPREADGPDGAGCTAVQRAAADGHEEVVKLLVTRGAEVNRQDTLHGNTALHEAAWKGYSRTVRHLAAAGADLSKCNAGGFTALHLCCQNGHNQTCRELLLAGCSPDVQNNYGDSALHTAARYGHAGATRILISGQCRVSEQNKNGDTALHIAAAMGRRKLTRILLEAGCDASVRNKQDETAADIAARKDLVEISDIIERHATSRRERERKRSPRDRGKKRSKSKVRFEAKQQEILKDAAGNKAASSHWSPYGCHYFPDPEAFPSPRLDSLPHEPLRRGEQYFLDLAGNICKGPVGVGFTCYCAPLFRHLEARLEKDKRELQKAQARLGQRVAGLEQKLNRSQHGRRSERVLPMGNRRPEQARETLMMLPRSRSLEMLDKMDRKATMQATRSMDELDPLEDEHHQTSQANRHRPSVKDMVAKFQQHDNDSNNSESSDDEDKPLRAAQQLGPMGDSNLASPAVAGAPPMPNYENVATDNGPRSRIGLYSPTVVNSVLIESKARRWEDSNAAQQVGRFQPAPQYYEHNLGAKLARLRVLEGSAKGYAAGGKMDAAAGDAVDRDTNNDSGYSTKVYGSSKGNSPSLSGQIDDGSRECLGLGASSLV